MSMTVKELAVKVEAMDVRLARIEAALDALTASNAVKKPTVKTSTSVKKSGNVIHIDRYGNKWIAEYDDAVYQKAKAEMIIAGEYTGKNFAEKRSKVYKKLGWIL